MNKTIILILLVLLFTPFATARWTPPDYSITERTVANISDCMNLSVHVEKASGNLSKGYSFKYCTQNGKDWTCNCRDNSVNGTFSLNVVSSNESERMFYLVLNYSQYTLYGGDARLMYYDNYDLKKDEEPRTILNENYYDYCPLPVNNTVYVDVVKEVPTTRDVIKYVDVVKEVENTTKITILEDSLKKKSRNNTIMTLIILCGVVFIGYSYYKNR